jgi:hypothetical protein
MACTTCGKSVFQTVKNITKGTINAVFETEEIKALATPRLAKCRACPHSIEVAKMNGISILQCGLCKCLCGLKARVIDEHCPIELW